MGITTTVLQKNQEMWAGIFNKAKGSIFGSKKAETKEKPRQWKHG
jgi:hypothetical protein